MNDGCTADIVYFDFAKEFGLGLQSLNMRHLRVNLIAADRVFSGGLYLEPSLYFIPPFQSFSEF